MKRTKPINKKEIPKNCILCLDPSLTAFGWAVVHGNKVYDSGCIKTKSFGKKSRIRKGDERVQRIQEINSAFIQILKNNHIAMIVAEQPHGSQSSSAAVSLGLMLALVQSLGDYNRIPIEWYSERDSKKHNLGKTEATKEEMIYCMLGQFEGWYREKYGSKAINEAVADSLAVYSTALFYSPIVKFINSNKNN